MSITLESVTQLLQSADFGDRLRAVNQMRQLNPAQAFDLIQTAATDSNGRVRYAAVSQIAGLGKQNLAQAATILRDRLIHDSEPDVQAAAADSLGALKITEAFEDIQRLYHHTSEWLLKFSIVAALGELGDRRSFPLLQSALDSGNDLVQTAAIGSLGELGDPQAIPLLLSYVSHTDWQIRYRVAQALSHFHTPESQAALQNLAQDAVQQVAQEAQTNLKTAS